MKKIYGLGLMILIAFIIVGCNGGIETLGTIDVVSREAGSGTRGAFEELVDFEDMLVENATIKDGNGNVATYVSNNLNAIGYVSFVTLMENEDKINGINVDGIEPTIENVLNGSYGISRSFNMAYIENNLNDTEVGFIAFLSSVEGLTALEESGAIVDKTDAISFDDSLCSAGNLVLGGSTSVEKSAKAAAEEYVAYCGANGVSVTYSYDSTGSSTGMKNAADGTYHIGFASRELKDSEKVNDLVYGPIARDGIAVVVNKNNTVIDITLEDIKKIYTGEITDWTTLQ